MCQHCGKREVHGKAKPKQAKTVMFRIGADVIIAANSLAEKGTELLRRFAPRNRMTTHRYRPACACTFCFHSAQARSMITMLTPSALVASSVLR